MAIPNLENVDKEMDIENQGFVVPNKDRNGEDKEEEVQVASLGFVPSSNMDDEIVSDQTEIPVPTETVEKKPVSAEVVQIAQAMTESSPTQTDGAGGLSQLGIDNLNKAAKYNLYPKPKDLPRRMDTYQRLLTTGALQDQRIKTQKKREEELKKEGVKPITFSWGSVDEIYKSIRKIPEFVSLTKGEEKNLYSLVSQFPEVIDGMSDAALLGVKKLIGTDTPDLLRLGFHGLLIMQDMNVEGQMLIHKTLRENAEAHNDSFYTNSIAEVAGLKSTKELAKMGKMYEINLNGRKRLVDRADYVKHVFDNQGVTKLFKEWANHIGGGITMNELDMSFLERASFYAPQFATPLSLIPFYTFAKVGQAFGRGFDSLRLTRYGGKGYSAEVTKWINESTKNLSKKELNYAMPKPSTHVVTGSGDKPIGSFKFLFDPRKEFDYWRYIDMTQRSLAAGLAGSAYASWAISNYGGVAYQQEYKNIPYLAAMGGYLIGGKIAGRALYRLPLATMPLTGHLASVIPPKGYVSLMSAMAQGTWAVLSRQKQRGLGVDELGVGEIKPVYRQGLAEIQQTKAGKILRLLTTTAPVSRILGAITKDRKGGTAAIDAVLASATMDAKSVAAMVKAINSMPEKERLQMEQGAQEFYESLERVVGRNGAEKWSQDMVLLDQLFALSNLKSLRNTYLARFESSDAFGTKTSANNWFFNKKSALSELDRFESLMYEQINLISKDLDKRRELYKRDPSGVMDRLIGHANGVLVQTRKDLKDFENVKAALMEETGRFAGMYDRYIINYLVNLPHTEGGFRVEKYISHPSFLTHKGPLTTEAKGAMVAENYLRFKTDSLLAFRAMSERMKQTASRAYPDNADMNMFVPVDSFLSKIEDSAFTENRFIASLAGIANISNVTKQGVITSARKNYLNARGFDEDPEGLLMYVTSLQAMLKTVDNGQITFKEGAEKITGIDNIFDKMIDDITGGDITGVIDTLSNIRGTNSQTSQLLREELPAVLKIGDVHKIRMSVWDKVQTNVDAVGGAKHANITNAKNVDQIFKDIFDPDNKENLNLTISGLKVIDSQGNKVSLNEEKIKHVLSRLIKANKFYEKNVGSVWNTVLGREFVRKNRTASEMMNDPRSVEDRWVHFVLSKAIDDIPDSGTLGHPSGIAMFNKIFSGRGPDITLRATKEFPEQKLTAEEFRELGINLFTSSIMKKVANGDLKFLDEVDDAMLQELSATKILTKEQVMNLVNYKRAAEQAKEGLFDTKIIKLNRDIKNDLEKLNETAKARINGAFLTQLDKRGELLDGHKLVKALFDSDSAKTLSIYDDAGEEVLRLRENVEQLKRLQKVMGRRGVEDVVNQAGGKLDEAQATLNRLSSIDSPIEVLLEAVGKDIAILDGLESLIFHHIHVSTLKPTNKRVPFGSAGVKLEDSFFDEANLALGTFNPTDPMRSGADRLIPSRLKRGINSGLQRELDPIALNKNFTKAIPILKAIYKKRMELGHNPKAAEDYYNQLKEMSDLLGLGAVFRGEVKTSVPRNMPSDLSLNQKQGKIYNAVRGFVSPTYLLLERWAMSYGINHAKIIQNVLLDPKAGRVLLDIAKNKKVSRSRFKILGNAIWGAIRGQQGVEEFQKISEDQINLMYKNAVKALAPELPPWYGQIGKSKRKPVVSIPLTAKTAPTGNATP